jgi:hypothetical protein
VKSKDLEMLGVYRMKDGSFRKIIGIFWKMNSTGKRVVANDPVGADIEYVKCDVNGHDIGNQKPRTCASTTFAKLAKEKVQVGSK